MSEDIYAGLTHEEVKKKRQRERERKWRVKNADKVKRHRQKYYQENRVELDEKRKVWKKNQPVVPKKALLSEEEKVRRRREFTKRYYESNKDVNRERNCARARQWAQDNPQRHAKRAIRYTKRLRSATPKWTRVAVMNVYYDKRDELNKLWGTKFEVDHIVPLNSEFVCGLHCPDNLQLLDKDLNAAKNNHTWVDMP